MASHPVAVVADEVLEEGGQGILGSGSQIRKRIAARAKMGMIHSNSMIQASRDTGNAQDVLEDVRRIRWRLVLVNRYDRRDPGGSKN